MIFGTENGLTQATLGLCTMYPVIHFLVVLLSTLSTLNLDFPKA